MKFRNIIFFLGGIFCLLIPFIHISLGDNVNIYTIISTLSLGLWGIFFIFIALKNFLDKYSFDTKTGQVTYLFFAFIGILSIQFFALHLFIEEKDIIMGYLINLCVGIFIMILVEAVCRLLKKEFLARIIISFLSFLLILASIIYILFDPIMGLIVTCLYISCLYKAIRFKNNRIIINPKFNFRKKKFL